MSTYLVMKKRLVIRSLIISLLVLVLVLTANPYPVHAVSSYYTHDVFSPGPPLSIDRLLDPISYSGFPFPTILSDIQSIQNPVPTSGDQPLLIVLVDFADKTGSFTLLEWEEYFFGSQGFADYFNEISHGALRYSGDVVGMIGGIPIKSFSTIAYVHLTQEISYYSAGTYGFGNVFPYNNAGVVHDALTILDEAGFDFKPYIDPSSEHVENLVVIFAGSNYGYTSDAVNSLEATAYSLTEGGSPGGFVASDGVLIDNYTFCPEKFGAIEGEIAHLGVCVHEHGHALGMFDLYDRSGQTTGSGRFDLMAYGSYGVYDGSRPFHPGVFTKQQLGWIEPSVILNNSREFYLSPAEIMVDGDYIEDYPQFMKIYPRKDIAAEEYFLLENRQPVLFSFDDEWYDAGLCPGLVIWHIDEGIVQDYALVNLVNTTDLELDYPPHPGVVVVEADGRYDMITSLNENENLLNFGECTDTWQVGSDWNDVSVPSARTWDGRTSRISVKVLYQIGSYLRVAVDIIEYNHQMYLPAIQR